MDESVNDEFSVDADLLKQQLETLANMKKGVSEANGDLRAKIKEILETAGYNKKALAIIRQIDAMSETQRADFLRTFEPMFDAMLQFAWQEDTEDMFAA